MNVNHTIKGRDVYEVANQLGGFVGPSTDKFLADFLIREADAAADLAREIVMLREHSQKMHRRAQKAEGLLKLLLEDHQAAMAKIETSTVANPSALYGIFMRFNPLWERVKRYSKE